MVIEVQPSCGGEETISQGRRCKIPKLDRNLLLSGTFDDESKTALIKKFMVKESPNIGKFSDDPRSRSCLLTSSM